MASLSDWSLHNFTHRREIRSVASAFVGELAAILHLIETHDVVSMLEKALDASDSLVALPNLTLPPFTIYTADAAKLGELPPPVPREIAYFYAQIASIQDDLTRLAREPFSGGPAVGRTERIRRVLTELNDALYLGDDIPRELRADCFAETSEVSDAGLIASWIFPRYPAGRQAGRHLRPQRPDRRRSEGGWRKDFVGYRQHLSGWISNLNQTSPLPTMEH